MPKKKTIKQEEDDGIYVKPKPKYVYLSETQIRILREIFAQMKS